MKRDYSATTSTSGAQPDRPPFGAVGGHTAASNLTTNNDENVAPNHQAKAKAYASTHTLNKPNPMSYAAGPVPMLDKESIARNTRAAIRRHALGDVSNVSLLNQTNSTSVAPQTAFRGATTRSRALAVKQPVAPKNETINHQSVQPTILAPAVQDWDDLDAEDADDPSMCTEYVNDIFAYLYDLETKIMADPNYRSNQGEITWKMRSVLIDWLVEVHWKLKLLPETLFLTVNLIDRFLSVRSVSLAKFQLVGITATLVASKYEEILSPSVSNFVYLSDGSFNEQEILKAECYLLNSLNFVLSSPTPYVFLRRVSKADNYDVQTRTLAKYFLETSLLDPIFLKYPPSQIAAASIFLARKMLNRGEWNANLKHYSNWDMASLYPVAKNFIEFFQRPIKYEAIFKKYSSKKFMKASLFVRDYIEKYYPAGGAAPQPEHVDL